MNVRASDAASPSQSVKELAHFIGGKPVAGRDRNSGGRFGDVFNPTTGELSARVPLASKAETEQAIEIARAAFPGWAETSPLARARVLFRFKELVERHMDELGHIISHVRTH